MYQQPKKTVGLHRPAHTESNAETEHVFMKSTGPTPQGTEEPHPGVHLGQLSAGP